MEGLALARIIQFRARAVGVEIANGLGIQFRFPIYLLTHNILYYSSTIIDTLYNPLGYSPNFI